MEAAQINRINKQHFPYDIRKVNSITIRNFNLRSTLCDESIVISPRIGASSKCVHLKSWKTCFDWCFFFVRCSYVDACATVRSILGEKKCLNQIANPAVEKKINKSIKYRKFIVPQIDFFGWIKILCSFLMIIKQGIRFTLEIWKSNTKPHLFILSSNETIFGMRNLCSPII